MNFLVDIIIIILFIGSLTVAILAAFISYDFYQSRRSLKNHQETERLLDEIGNPIDSRIHRRNTKQSSHFNIQ